MLPHRQFVHPEQGVSWGWWPPWWGWCSSRSALGSSLGCCTEVNPARYKINEHLGPVYVTAGHQSSHHHHVRFHGNYFGRESTQVFNYLHPEQTDEKDYPNKIPNCRPCYCTTHSISVRCSNTNHLLAKCPAVVKGDGPLGPVPPGFVLVPRDTGRQGRGSRLLGLTRVIHRDWNLSESSRHGQILQSITKYYRLCGPFSRKAMISDQPLNYTSIWNVILTQRGKNLYKLQAI